jgi:ketosteroid isomerase-like protein
LRLFPTEDFVRQIIAVAILALALVSGCGWPPGTSNLVTEEEHRERAAAAHADYEAALIAGDADDVVAMYDEDAWIRGVGSAFESVRGKARYRDVLRDLLPAVTITQLNVDIEDVLVLGDHVFESGSFSENLRIGDTGDPVSLRGSYAALWRYGEDGWKIKRFVWNEQPPAEPTDGS